MLCGGGKDEREMIEQCCSASLSGVFTACSLILDEESVLQVVLLMKYLKAELLLHTFNPVTTPAELPPLLSEFPLSIGV